jgi:hypothetical protein
MAENPRRKSTNGREEELLSEQCSFRIFLVFLKKRAEILYVNFSLNKPFPHIQSVLVLKPLENNIHLTT